MRHLHVDSLFRLAACLLASSVTANTTETLQELVEAAGSAQRAQGKTPTVMVTIADHAGVARTARHTSSYFSPFCFLQRGLHTGSISD